jgi:hypothetical protein
MKVGADVDRRQALRHPAGLPRSTSTEPGSYASVELVRLKTLRLLFATRRWEGDADAGALLPRDRRNDAMTAAARMIAQTATMRPGAANGRFEEDGRGDEEGMNEKRRRRSAHQVRVAPTMTRIHFAP